MGKQTVNKKEMLDLSYEILGKEERQRRYFIEEDRINVRPQMAKGMFCCKSCFNSYNG